MAFYFSGEDDLPRGDKGLAGHLRLGIKCEEVVDEGVADLVCNFIGMSFTNGLGGKKVTHIAGKSTQVPRSLITFALLIAKDGGNRPCDVLATREMRPGATSYPQIELLGKMSRGA